MMSKKIFSMILVSIMVCSFVSCGNNKDVNEPNSSSSSDSGQSSSSSSESSKDDTSSEDTSSNTQEKSADGLAQELLKQIKFKDSMSKIDNEMALLLYNIDKNIVLDCAVYVSTGATAEEIAVFRVKEDTGRGVLNQFDKKIAEKRTSFKDYNPQELEKLTDPTVINKGEYVVLCISDDDSKSRETIKNYIG